MAATGSDSAQRPMRIETKLALRSRKVIALASIRAFGMSASATAFAILCRASKRAGWLPFARAAWMPAAASSSVIIFDGSMAVGAADSLVLAVGLAVACGLGLGAVFDLRAAGLGGEFDTLPLRPRLGAMAKPAAPPNRAS